MISNVWLALLIGLVSALATAALLPPILRRLPAPAPEVQLNALIRPGPILATSGLTMVGAGISLPWLPISLWPP